MTNLVLIAPFPPHKGGIAYCSEMFLERQPPELGVLPVGFRSVFPTWLHPGSGGAQWDPLPGIAYPFTGFNPPTWRLAAGLAPGGTTGILMLPWWTAALAPATLGIIKHFKRTHPGWKTLLWCHNVRDHESGPIARRLTARAFHRADGFVVHSEAARGELLELHPGARVLTAFHPLYPLPVPMPPREEARAALGVRPDRLMVLFMGAVRPYKGADVLLDAIRILNGDPRFFWSVAGDFWRGTRRLIPSFRALGANVEPGFLSWDRMALLLAAADLLVLPYRRASGSGMLMTAYAHGLPVLTSAVPHLQEFLPDGYPAPRAGDPAALARALESLASDPAALPRMRGQCAARAGHFTWERFFSLLLPFIERLEIN